MKTFLAWLRSQDRNDLMYWLGLLMLFAGISLTVSAATALIVIGAIVVGVSIATSFFVTWLSASEKK